ncbi:MAG: NblA/ycf18 family protein [Cyanobacteria bacterium P01_F01_bin.42]
MESALSLSLEQEFSLKSFRQQLDEIQESQKDEIILEVMRQLMIKNNVIRHLVSTTS